MKQIKLHPLKKSNHVVICGFSTLGRLVAKNLEEKSIEFVIISDNLKQVQLARKIGYKAYFGHLEKLPVLQSLKIEESSSIILTVTNFITKRVICEAVLDYEENANLVVKIDSVDEKKQLKDLHIQSFIHAQHEVSNLLVNKSLEFKK